MDQNKSNFSLTSVARCVLVMALAFAALLACTSGPGLLPASGPTQAQPATATPPPAQPSPTREAAPGTERPTEGQVSSGVVTAEQPSPTASPRPQSGGSSPSPTATAKAPAPTPAPTATPVAAPRVTPTPSPVPTPDPLGEAFFLRMLSPSEDTSFVTVPRATVEGVTRVDAVVSVNDDLVTVDETGRFQAEVGLEEGPNLVEVVASVASGEELSAILTIFYLP